jgi:isopentenyl diphosphate isomerase/L-lactate dehydrogenase-like FMN-dependent dehydrogenase
LRALQAGGRAEARRWLELVENELKAAMLLTGCANVSALRTAPRVVSGELRQWLEQLRA